MLLLILTMLPLIAIALRNEVFSCGHHLSGAELTVLLNQVLGRFFQLCFPGSIAISHAVTRLFSNRQPALMSAILYLLFNRRPIGIGK